ncbi:MAG: helix-turn-helix transcriptional regulator [Mycobacterium sp.]
MTQSAFAAAIGVKEGSLAAWETDRATPRDIVSVAKRVEMLTNVPAAWLLGLGGPTSAQPSG